MTLQLFTIIKMIYHSNHCEIRSVQRVESPDVAQIDVFELAVYDLERINCVEQPGRVFALAVAVVAVEQLTAVAVAAAADRLSRFEETANMTSRVEWVEWVARILAVAVVDTPVMMADTAVAK